MRLAGRVAAALAEIDGVTAVVLGGSLARNVSTPWSDVDLGLYYRPGSPPSLEDLSLLAWRVDDRGTEAMVTDIGEWGPWINGGAWLVIDGVRVDWIFRDLALVERTVQAVLEGRVTCDYQAGHPHGFHSHVYAGEVHHAVRLHDPDDAVGALQALTDPYPGALRRTILQRFLWEAAFALTTARTAAARGDTYYVSGCLFRSVACVVQVLYALNARWFLNEKGSVAEAAAMPTTVDGLQWRVAELLGRVGIDAPSQADQLRLAGALVQEAAALVPDES